MLILRWIDSFSGHKRMVDDLSNRLAARCERAVWARTFPLATTMDPAQARGYIRARARLVVARELQISSAQLAVLSPKLIEELKRGITERLVGKTLAEVAVQCPPRLAGRRAA